MRSLRVLHVVGAMNRGGVETWLMNVIRNIDQQRFQMDFLVHSKLPGAFDDEIRKLGCQIYHCPIDTKRPWRYSRSFRNILRQHGPYDVVHSHVFLFSGQVLRVAETEGIPIRISHSHTTNESTSSQLSPYRRVYKRLMASWIDAFATHKIGVSEAAGRALFGRNWLKDNRSEVLLYGFDFSRFEQQQDKQALKSTLGIPAGRKVIGHVGRFAPVKNHKFLLDLFSVLLNSDSNRHLLLVGDGPLMEEIQHDIQMHDLADHCTLVGNQADTAPFFKMMDLFVFPSHYEGFGIVVLEAQAAGVPTLAAASVPTEVDVVPGMVKRMELAKGIDAWSDCAQEILASGHADVRTSFELVASSVFGIRRCLIDLERIYRG